MKLSKLSLAFIYPLLLIGCFYVLYRNKKYQSIIKNNYKDILRNSLIILGLFTLAILIYFHFENTIYTYDYSGHWIRYIFLDTKYSNPLEILDKVYQSMNYDEYSFLPALFQLGFALVSYNYTFFVYSCFICFLMPSVLLLQVLYFSYTDKHTYLPILIFGLFYPLYITLFFGKVDACGFFFLILAYMLFIFNKFEDIQWSEVLWMNVFGFLMVFLRRWYLYPLVGFYIAYFIKYLVYVKFKPFNKHGLQSFLKVVSSGIILLAVILLFFRPYFFNLFASVDPESYEFWSRDNKLLALINFYSPIIFMISIYGGFHLVKTKKEIIPSLCILVGSLIPYLLFIRMQSLEQHHYFIINFGFLCLFSVGLYQLIHHKQLLSKLLISILLIQNTLIFIDTPMIPGFTTLKKIPFVHKDKQAVIDFSSTLQQMLGEYEYAYMATGTYLFNDDVVRNALLPDLNELRLVSAVFDIRDGFPHEFEYIRYIVLSDPTFYLGEAEYQQMYDVISQAILEEPLFKDMYLPVYTTTILEHQVTIYERQGELSDAHLQYLYDEMVDRYPDKPDLFTHILER